MWSVHHHSRTFSWTRRLDSLSIWPARLVIQLRYEPETSNKIVSLERTISNKRVNNISHSVYPIKWHLPYFVSMISMHRKNSSPTTARFEIILAIDICLPMDIIGVHRVVQCSISRENLRRVSVNHRSPILASFNISLVYKWKIVLDWRHWIDAWCLLRPIPMNFYEKGHVKTSQIQLSYW